MYTDMLIIGEYPCYSQDVSCVHLIEGTWQRNPLCLPKRKCARHCARWTIPRSASTSSTSGWSTALISTPERVRVELTMTTPACPMGDTITDHARRAVGALLPDGVGVDVELVWDPIVDARPDVRERKADLRLARLILRPLRPRGRRIFNSNSRRHRHDCNRDHHHRRANHRFPASAIRLFSAPSTTSRPAMHFCW